MPKFTRQVQSAVKQPAKPKVDNAQLIRIARREYRRIADHYGKLLAQASIPHQIIDAHIANVALVAIAQKVRETNPEHLHDLTVILAREGEPQAARQVLEDFIEAARANPEGDVIVAGSHARYIADAFQAILEGKDPAKALGLKFRKSGRPKGVVTHHRSALAAGYSILLRHGLKPTQARNEIQGITGADDRTIREAIKARPNFAYPELVDDDALRVFGRRLAEKIDLILAHRRKR